MVSILNKNHSKNIKHIIKTAILCLLLCVLSAGCQGADASEETAPVRVQDTVSDADLIADLPAPIDTDATEEEEAETAKDELPPEKDSAGLSDEQVSLYQQASLYIQEGFRTYGIEGDYHVYFAPLSSSHNSVDAAITCGEEQWYEHFSYAYDEQTGWYSFTGQYEPVLAKETDYSHSEIEKIMDSYVYETAISKDAEIPVIRRYDAEGGPIEHDGYFDYGRDCLAHLYTYRDDRMDVYVTIQYPQLNPYVGDTKLSEIINESLREAFFNDFSYDSSDDGSLHPSDLMYTSIDRQFMITRQDDDYLSVRMNVYNDSRGAAHPNEWEEGITIDMRTGHVLSLEDVVGEGWTMEKLLDSGAFKEMSGDQEWIDRARDYIHEYHSGESLSEYSAAFYITDTSLGLVVDIMGYATLYNPTMEAKFSDLGISGF